MTFLPDQRRGLDLSIPTFGIGRNGRFPQMPGMPQMPQPIQAQQPPSTARATGIAEALSNPVTVESGTWGEAIAEALGAGIRGRTARRDRERSEFTENEERQREQAQREAISRALEGFNPSDPQAMVGALSQGAPEQAMDLATALMRREPSERWSDPYDMNGVPVQRNERDNQIRPVVTPNAQTIYQPPSGYRGSPEAGLEPIPGGPADVRQSAEGRSRMQQMDSSMRQLDNAIGVLNDLSTIQNDATGFLGGMTRGIPGTPGYDLNQQLEPVRAILSFENLAEMRRNSQTGGALGSIAVRELELLGNTVRSLDTAQSPEQLANNIRETRRQLQRTQQALQAARQELGQAPGEEAPPVNDGSAPDQPRVRVWRRETGRVE